MHVGGPGVLDIRDPQGGQRDPDENGRDLQGNRLGHEKEYQDHQRGQKPLCLGREAIDVVNRHRRPGHGFRSGGQKLSGGFRRTRRHRLDDIVRTGGRSDRWYQREMVPDIGQNRLGWVADNFKPGPLGPGQQHNDNAQRDGQAQLNAFV